VTAVSIPRPWHPVTRIAFRFCFADFGLFCLVFAQMILLDPVTSWVGRHVFGVDAVRHRDSGSGDQAAIWVLTFCLTTHTPGSSSREFPCAPTSIGTGDAAAAVHELQGQPDRRGGRPKPELYGIWS
jgi:hypothetical protein